MGLTVSYDFTLKSASVEEVREKITALRNIAINFPGAEVYGLIELAGKNCGFPAQRSKNSEDDPLLDLKVRAVKDGNMRVDENLNFYFIHPKYIVAFDTLPAAGCSPAAFGLATMEEIGKKNNWYWHCYCKNQYASNPEYGGVENFIKSHLFLISILDEISKLGIKCKVNDPTGYWKSRKLKDLTDNIEEANLLVAAIIGSLKTSFEAKGMRAEAPILEYPNFEYLEAKGLDEIQLGQSSCSDDDQS
jgi:hypothetical protein